MNIRTSLFAASAVLVVGSFLVNCSSDAPAGTNSVGGSKAGAPSGGAVGTAGSPSVAGAPSGGAGAGGAGGSNAGSAGAAVAAGAGGGSSVPATFATVQRIISMQCFGNGCHSQEGNPLQMKVDSSLYNTLMTHLTATCGKLVDTTNPASSALVKVLQSDCNGTPRMPFQMCFSDGDPGCVVPEDIAAIQAWIAKGAPQQ